MNADGTGLQKAVTAIMGLENSASAWSPDGSFLVYMDDRRFTGGPPGGQVFAQSVGEGTNTKLTDIRDVIFLSIAEARWCGRYFHYPRSWNGRGRTKPRSSNELRGFRFA